MKSNKRVGVFEHESNAFRSIERLIEAGFNPSDISVLYHSESEVEN
jgi:diketogulonate reductase-like aldo/keto reductase